MLPIPGRIKMLDGSCNGLSPLLCSSAKKSGWEMLLSMPLLEGGSVWLSTCSASLKSPSKRPLWWDSNAALCKVPPYMTSESRRIPDSFEIEALPFSIVVTYIGFFKSTRWLIRGFLPWSRLRFACSNGCLLPWFSSGRFPSFSNHPSRYHPLLNCWMCFVFPEASLINSTWNRSWFELWWCLSLMVCTLWFASSPVFHAYVRFLLCVCYNSVRINNVLKNGVAEV